MTARSGVPTGLVDAPAILVDPALAVAEPVHDLERGVVEHVGQDGAQRDPASSDTRIRAAADRSKRLRRTPARKVSGTAANAIRKSTQTTEYGAAADLVDHDRNEQEGECRPTREIDRAKRAALSRRGSPPAPGEDDRDPEENDADDDRPGQDDRVA